jgi:hypothetical protein
VAGCEQEGGCEAEGCGKLGASHWHRQVRATAHCNPLLEATIGKRLDARRDSGQETAFIFRVVDRGIPSPLRGYF